MRALIQRVTEASVTIRETMQKSSIGYGMVVLLGVGYEDSAEDVEYLCRKIAALRIFDDENGVMNRSLVDIHGELLVVSQFTLMADTSKGNRPSYIRAARADISEPLYQSFVRMMSDHLGRPVATGCFGADMLVEIKNDGPVTILIDSHNR